ncbi:MAG: porin family protein, partial [candidate division Zixibacteria bacterium]|nr:porin family protein [candidate division Zixibacteria bacterium]
GSDTDPKLILGVDFKYEFMDYYDKNGKQPMDMAFGGFLEYVDYGAISVLELGGNYIASIPYRFKSGRRLIPYGRVNLRLESISVDTPGGNNDSDFKFGLNLGVKYELTTEMNLYGEFQFDGLSGLFLGLDVRMF